ncbi:MAG TPA: type II secretion system protein [Candidatus Paceibacterota bacterium]|nr:type II secretion system protein [Candidatus Paceibacterota bacterium]
MQNADSLRGRLSCGFTIIELLVVLGIIAVIMGIVLTSQGNFNRSIVLANTAYDIALTVRSAETYGISSRASAASPNTGYGLHFDAGNQSSFILFADTNPAASCTTPGCTPPGNHVYTQGLDVLVQTYSLGNNITIQDFCAYINNAWSCASNTAGITSLDVVYARPNPTAYMSRNGVYSSSISAACLLLASTGGTTRSITIWGSGAINPNASPPCP